MGNIFSTAPIRFRSAGIRHTSAGSVALWLLALLPFHTAWSQTAVDTNGLMADFYDETSNTAPKTVGTTGPEAIRAILPQELWQITNPLSIGISDPGLDSATGYRQAWHRALMLLALQEGSRVKMVAENFKSTKEMRNGIKSRFEEMYGVEAEIYLTQRPWVASYYRLSNGETILILADGTTNPNLMTPDTTTSPSTPIPADSLTPAFNPSSDTLIYTTASDTSAQPDAARPSDGPTTGRLLLKAHCSLYHLEVAANKTQQIFRTEYTLTGLDSVTTPDHENFGYTSVNGRWCNLTTHINGVELPKNDTRYFYYNGNQPVAPDSTLDNSIGMATIEGLWPALITGVLWQITGIAADTNTTTIRQVSDQYDQSQRDLSRVIENHRLTFRLNRMAYASARLFTLLDIKTVYSGKQ